VVNYGIKYRINKQRRPPGVHFWPTTILYYNINDLMKQSKTVLIYLYADDCSLFLPVKRNEDALISHNLVQNDLNKMSEWSVKCRSYFSYRDCPQQSISDLDSKQLVPNQRRAPKEASHKHVSVTLDEHLKSIILSTSQSFNPLKSLTHQNIWKLSTTHSSCLTINMGQYDSTSQANTT
jgi:hypothetical protein